jgi:hypothetical protein
MISVEVLDAAKKFSAAGEVRISEHGYDEMNSRSRVKLVREGQYVAEVEVELIEDQTGWSPYLSPQVAYELGDVRDALRRGDIGTAARLARVFELRQVAAQ